MCFPFVHFVVWERIAHGGRVLQDSIPDNGNSVRTEKRGSMDGQPKAFRSTISPVLVFLLATLAAMIFQYVSSAIIERDSPALIVLPVVGGLAFTLFARTLWVRHCARCRAPEENARLRAEHAALLNDAAHLRRQTSEAERQVLALQRQVAEWQHSDYAVKRHESRFQAAFHATPDPIMFVNVRTGNIMDVNESLLRLPGFGWQEVINAPLSKIVRWSSTEDATRFAGLAESGSESNLRATMHPPASEESATAAREFLLSARRMELDGVPCDILVARDVSDLRQAEDVIRKLSRAMEQSSTGVAITDLAGHVEYVNPRFTEITGTCPSQIQGRQPDFLNTLEGTTQSQIWLAMQQGEPWKGEILTRRDDTQHWLRAAISPIMDEAGHILHGLIVLDDITAQKQQDEYVHFMAMHDGLTSMPNRRLFMDRLRQTVAVYQRSATPFALLFMDLNNFKQINDTLGHDAGDKALREVSKRITGTLRAADTAARLGGDEFVVLLHDVRAEHEVRQACQRLANDIARPMRLCGNDYTIHAAIGAALCPLHGTEPDELLTLADSAMYRCKRTPGALFAWGNGPCILSECSEPI